MTYILEASRDQIPLQGVPLEEGVYFIGSYPSKKKGVSIVLEAENIEPEHARIEYKEGRLTIYKLSRKEPLLVNRNKVRSTILAWDDVIHVGPYCLNFVEQGKKVVLDTNLLRRRMHNELVARLDLRSLNIEQLSDKDLWNKCSGVLDGIVESSYIPESIDTDRLKLEVLREALALGPLEEYLADKDVTEIMVNSKDEIFVERQGKLSRENVSFTSSEQVLNVITRIVSPIGRRIDASRPLVDARLKDGSRVNAIIPPLALKGPSITIRKFSDKKLTSEDLIKYHSMTADMAEFLEFAVKGKRNVVIAGGTGSGKTTLLNVLSNYIPASERIVTIEDSAELKLYHENLVSLEARPPNIEGRGAIPIRDLVKNSLRMRPDRIIVGECRSGETLDMLQAMNTGHDGSLTTLHANSPDDAILRLETMVMMAGFDLPIRVIRKQIASAVHVFVQQNRLVDGSRKVTSIMEVLGMEGEEVRMKEIFTFKRTGFDGEGKVTGYMTATGYIPHFVEEFEKMGLPLSRNLFVPKKIDSGL